MIVLGMGLLFNRLVHKYSNPLVTQLYVYYQDQAAT